MLIGLLSTIEKHIAHAVTGFFLTTKVQDEGNFITRKITRGLAKIDAGLEKLLFLGNLNKKGLGTR